MESPLPKRRLSEDPLVWSVLISLLLIAEVSYYVYRTKASLGWDDTDYLAFALKGARRLLHGMRPINPGGRPPMFSCWLLFWSLIFGPDKLMPLVVAGSVVPFALLLLSTAAICLLLRRSPAIPYALVILGAAPLVPQFGGSVMVEIFLALWVLLTIGVASVLLEKPRLPVAFALGLLSGLAVMTKLSAVVILLPAAIYFVWQWWAKAGVSRHKLMNLAVGALGLLLVAGPFYFRSYRAIVQHAAYASHFNEYGMGQAEGSSKILRLVDGPMKVFGWPVLLAAAGTLIAIKTMSSRAAVFSDAGRRRHFFWMSLASTVFAGVFLCFPAYYEYRFFMPVAPLGAVLFAIGLQANLANFPAMMKPILLGLLGVGLLLSGHQLNRSIPHATKDNYRDTLTLLERLANHPGIVRISNLGNCANWNASKLNMISQLGQASNGMNFEEASRYRDEDALNVIALSDAVFVLDQSEIPQDSVELGPAQNQSYNFCRAHLPPDFVLANGALISGLDLPKIKIYLKKRLGTGWPEPSWLNAAR